MSNIKTLNRGGRKPGATNLATRAKVALASAAVAVLAGKLTDAEANAMTPLDVLLACMRAAWLAGDLAGARVAAAEAAPYLHGRASPVFSVGGIPADMLLDTDPLPQPDEPGPPGGVIH